MSYINVMMAQHGWSLISIPARYTSNPNGEIIVGLGYSQELLNEYMDAYTSGGDIGSDADRIEHEVPEYPIVRAEGFFNAIELLEKKLERLKVQVNDSAWRTEMALQLQKYLDIVYRRAG